MAPEKAGMEREDFLFENGFFFDILGEFFR
jgi:hypothetical protein